MPGVPSSCCFGIRGRSYSNFLASTVGPYPSVPKRVVSLISAGWGGVCALG